MAQIATDAKSNEITTVPKLLILKGTDALNSQYATAQQIMDQEGGYRRNTGIFCYAQG